MKERLARLVKRGPKAGTTQPDRLQPTPSPQTASRTTSRSRSPFQDNGNNPPAGDASRSSAPGKGPGGSTPSDNGTTSGAVPPADSNDDMWAVAYTELRKDPEKQKKLDEYETMLVSHLGCSIGRRSTADTQRVLGFLNGQVASLQKDADTPLRRCTETAKKSFQTVLRYVIKVESLVNTAAQSCLPAALACAGVMILSRLCLDAVDQRHVLFESLSTVAGAIRRLAEYEQLLWERSRQRLEEAEGSMVSACKNIIEFQIRIALFLQRNPLESAIRDAFKLDGWDNLLSSIAEAEASVRGCAERKSFREVTAIFGMVQDIPDRIDEGFARQERARAALERNKEVASLLQLLRKSGCDADTIKDRNRERVTGTCNWFTDHDLFKAWNLPTAGSALGLLYVTADPGCGKSVLSKYLLDRILPDDGRIVCHFFFKDDFVEQKSARSAMCTLLHQIFVADTASLTDSILTSYQAQGSAFVESFDILWQTFLASTCNRKVVVLLDALDECRESDRKHLISKIIALYEHGRTKATSDSSLKFLLTSRPYQDISRRFTVLDDPTLPSIHLQGDKGESSDDIAKEIARVVDVRITETAKAFHLTDAEKEIMTQQLHAIPNRTYLWITLLFDGLIDRKTELTKRDILGLTRQPPKGVDDAYEAILLKSTDTLMAKKVLSIVLAANKPLTAAEIAVALAIKGSNQSREEMAENIIPDNRIQQSIKDYCGLFVVFVDDKIYLLHQTAREFLLRLELGPGAALLTRLRFYLTCLAAILFQLLFGPSWKHGFTTEAANAVLAEICMSYIDRHLTNDHPSLCQYAAVYWMDHYLESSERYRQTAALMAWNLCELCEQEISWTRHLGYIKYGYPLHGPAICMASALGLGPAINVALNQDRALVDGNTTDMSTEGNCGRTPLLWAARNGHKAVIQQLLRTGEVDVNSNDDSRKTPLMHAAFQGHDAIVKQLLETGKADINAKDMDGRTPLLCAAANGHDGIVKQLLETGKADINAKDESGCTPLIEAVYNGHESIVKQLIKTGKADLNAQDEDGWTPLMVAIGFKYEAIAKQLLDTGQADLNTQDNAGMTPLMHAAWRGHEALVKQLLETGEVDINAENEHDDTAFTLAKREGYETITKLLQSSIDATAQEKPQGISLVTVLD